MNIDKSISVADFGYLNVPILDADASLEEASKKILETGIKALPVVDDTNALIGLISLNDITKQNDITIGNVKSVMSKSTYSIKENEPITKALEILYKRNKTSDTSTNYSSIPVIASDRATVIGMIDYKDILLGLKPIIGEIPISKIINSKTNAVTVVDDTPEKILFYMTRTGIGQAIVVEKQDEATMRPIGVMKITDLLIHTRNAQAFGNGDITTRELMIKLDTLKILQPRQKIERVIDLFVLPHLDLMIFPVTYKNNLIGTVSFLDIVKFALSFLENDPNLNSNK